MRSITLPNSVLYKAQIDVYFMPTGIVKLIKTIRSLMIFTVAAVIGSINFTCRLAPIVMCNIITISIVTIK